MSKDKEKCEAFIDKALAQDDRLRQIMEAMDEAGCPVGRSFFRCCHCVEPARGYFKTGVGIYLCQNRMNASTETIRSTMRHELIHAYDDCRAKMNPNSCAHHACTEIRASNLSGECEFPKEMSRRVSAKGLSMLPFRKQQQDCIRRRVKLTLQMSDCCKGKDLDAVVDSVWNTCYKDIDPFEVHPSTV